MTDASALLETNTRLFLERQLRLGRAVLFTGAGFSSSARNLEREYLPLGKKLREELWPLAFPGLPYDAESTLGEVYDRAVRQNKIRTIELLRRRLTVHGPAIPDFYERYLRIPWYRIYTLNFDNLIPEADRHFGTSLHPRVVSAVRGMNLSSEELDLIYLNGVLDDYPDLTFSPPQYGHRANHHDIAYNTLTRDLAGRTVIFVGTELDEPPLWQYLEMRGERPPGRELRPRSFLVTPSLRPSRVAMLERYNVKFIAMDAEQFAEEYLAPVAAEGNLRPARPHQFSALISLESALREPAQDPADLFLGREPTWADITEGYAVEREFESDLLRAARATRVVIIAGNAGSGKSVTLRRLALTLQAEGKAVVWVRLDSPDSLGQLRSLAVSTPADVVVIDRAERFRERSLDLIRDVATASDGRQVIAAYASTLFDELQVEQHLADLDVHTTVVPLLSERDIDLLIDALARAKRLGHLAGLTPQQKRHEIARRAHRQLLVALLEATSNENFEEKLRRECDGLAGDLHMAYAVAALATTHRYRISLDDVLAALSDVTGAGLEIIDRLVRQHLLLRDSEGGVAARHPVIAREVIDYYRGSGQLADAIMRLAFVLATKLPGDRRRTPEARLLASLINHEYVRRNISSVVQVRDLYQELEDLLADEAHYWLQRGSYELEQGDLPQAEIFLAQARGMASGDYMIETEWAYLFLERAARYPTDVRAKEWFADASGILLDIIERQGDKSANSFVVLGQQTIAWCAAASITLEEKKALLQLVRATMRRWERHHRGNRQFRAAQDDVDRAYLALAQE